MKLTFATLFSGSSGNAVYIRAGEDAILIDAGKSCRYIENCLREIGADMSKVRAVFVTHEHIDHIQALPVLRKKYNLPVYIPADCRGGHPCLPEDALYYDGLCDLTVGPFRVRSFYTPHDSFGAMGYTVEVFGKKIGVATDMGLLATSVVEALSGCDAALIECNYDEEMLRNGSYSAWLKARIAGEGGHLSNSDGALLAAVLASGGTGRILLGHMSAENNTPEKVNEAVKREFEKRGVSAYTLVADREKPTVLLEEDI